MATKQTMDKYQQLFDKLVKDYIHPNAPTGKRVAKALMQKANEGMSKNYFYRLKTACVSVQKANGFKDEAERIQRDANWPTVKDENGKDKPIPKKKSRIAKRLTNEDFQRLLGAAEKLSKDSIRKATVKDALDPKERQKLDLEALKDAQLVSAMRILKVTGMRPEELYHAKVMKGEFGEPVLFIEGAKKVGGIRGADRYLDLKNDLVAATVQSHLEQIQNPNGLTKEALSARFNRLAAKVLPKQRISPTLKTFRHQMSSDLKAQIHEGKMDKLEAAYLLGHQSVDSMDKYGDRRMANGGQSFLTPAANMDVSNIREPSAEVKDLVDNASPSAKMNHKNLHGAARNHIKAQKESVKNQSITRSYSSDNGLSYEP